MSDAGLSGPSGTVRCLGGEPTGHAVLDRGFWRIRSRNLAADPRLVLHLEDGEEPLILHGEATATGPASERPALIEAYTVKYTGEHDEHYLPGAAAAAAAAQVFEVAPSKALAWRVVAPDDWAVRRWSVYFGR